MSESDSKTTTGSISFPHIPCLPEGSVVLGKSLGRGGFGCVYQGTYDRVPVAVKQIINPNLSPDAARKMVQNELKFLLRLRHSNFICQVIGYQYADRSLSIVMTLAENGDLQKYLTTGRLSNNWSTKARICLDIAKAVKSVHDENIFHGDLKAANVLLDRFLIPKLTDFGISKGFYSSISSSSSICGTLRYVAPERFVHPEKKFDFREHVQIDTYGYGLILWETVTDGSTPYKDKDDDGIYIAKMKKTDPLQFIGEPPSGVPAAFGDLIQQFLEWEPSRRPPITLALHTFDAYINTNPIMLSSLSSDNSTTTLTQTVNVFATSTENPFKDCELFTNDEINILSKAHQKLYEGSRFYFRKNNYQKAIEYLNKPEILDQVVVQRALGLCYQANNDEFEAFVHFKESAINDDTKGQYYLAWCFDHGYGTDSDKAGALILYSLSAAHGVAEAKSALCDMKWTEYNNRRQQLNESVDIMKLLRVSIITVNNSGQTLLHWVAEQGHIEVVRLLVTELGLDVNVKDNHGRTPLHQAVDNGHIEVIKILVTEFGAKVDAQDNDKLTPLHWAAANGHIKVVRILITELGAEVSVKDKDGRTLILWAADNGYIKVVKLLVTELGVDPNDKDNDGRTLLLRAADNGCIEVVKLLVTELGADLNDKDNDGRTLLHRATDNGLVEVVQSLVTEFGQNANARDKDGRTLLHYAVDKEQFGIVNLLAVDLGADINAKDNKGCTLLHLAAEKGENFTLRLLVELGANANTEDYRGRVPLHAAIGNERFETMKLLVSEFGADVNVKDEDGRTPLHLATENGHIEAMKLLVKLGADTNVKDKDGRTPLHEAVDKKGSSLSSAMPSTYPSLTAWYNGIRPLFSLALSSATNLMSAAHNAKNNSRQTPLHVAAEKGQVEIVRLLVATLGADTKVKENNGRTPLHQAAEKGHFGVVKLLVDELGADLNAKNNGGQTPLHEAAEKGQIEIVRLLVAIHGADTKVKENNGRTPLHQAAEKGHFEVVKLLVGELGADPRAKNNVGKTPLDEAMASGHAEIVKWLNLRGIIPEKEARSLSEFLKNPTIFTKLNLSCMSEISVWLFNVGDSIQLTCAYLLGNGIGDKGARALAESLKQNTTLTRLNLEGNEIGDEGARALGESLEQNTTLTRLNLEGNKIGDEGARALSKSLNQNTTLTQLDLSDNQIGDLGARALKPDLSGMSEISVWLFKYG